MANDFRQFNVSLDDFTRRVGLAPATVAKRVAFDLFGRIVRKTPVDTGRARASWNISVNHPNRSVVARMRTIVKRGTHTPKGLDRPSLQQAVSPSQNKSLFALNVKPGDEIWITNNLPYIVELEKGHSKQAPAGMVALSIEEVTLAMGRLEREGLRDVGL